MTEVQVKQASGYRLVIGYLGIITIFIGIIILLPLLALVFIPEESGYALNFLIPGILAILIGFGGYSFIHKREKGRLHLHHDAIIVFFSWVLAILFSSFPMYLLGEYSFSESFFEMTSGWTTTGFTIVNFDTLPKIYFLYRSISHFFGGIGLILVMLSALSDTFGMKLYNAEGHLDKLMPNLAKSTRIIFTIYSGFIVTGMLLYRIFGMSWFDAINHSIASVATGGFSTKADSIMAFESILNPGNYLAIQVVTIILMLLGSINFLAHLMIITGKFKRFFKDSENRTYFSIIAILVIIVTLISVSSKISFKEGFMTSLFMVISSISTTGYSIVPTLAGLGPFIIFVLMIAMFIGGESGSTSGGTKVYRIDILFRSFYYHLRNRFVASKNIKRFDYIHKLSGKEVIDHSKFTEIAIFAFTMIVIIVVGSMVFLSQGYSFEESLFEALSSVTNTGLSSGIIKQGVSPVVLWTSTIGMILGRLEIFIVFIALIKLSKDGLSGFTKSKKLTK